ncbi:MAG: cyclic nucleotide-binding domain-containing protein [Pseudomonadota bacterium]|nr:cyclic nucleotide-binding domain-containing protein [Pseudomonadota bacterium]
MESAYWTYLIWATGIGALSAVSLPLGSVVGLAARFRPLTLSLLAAFGAGALIAALSVELVAPNVSALQHAAGGSVHGDAYRNFLALIVGAICGGVAFVVLDQVVNAHGGFLRKTASTLAYFRMQKRARVEQLIKEAAEVPFLQDVPPHDVHRLANMVRPVTFSKGEVLFEQGDTADALIFIRSGSVRFTDHGQHLTEMAARNMLGAIELLTGAAHPVTVVANESVECLYISKEQFDEFRKMSPAFDEACRKVASEHLELLKEYHARDTKQAQEWAQEAIQSLRMGTEPPTTIELLRARQEHRGAPLAVWLGILLDGIPESLVIGFGFLTMLSARLTSTGSVAIGEVIPYTLVAGLFLSNFPEALSSSANMRQQGWSKSTIFNLWFSLMVITALGAGLGYVVGETLPHAWLVFAEGLAAGAMLTMIASTMIPEAVHLGNPSAVGLGTLAGFLSAITFKLLE